MSNTIDIELINVSKKFNRKVIFQNINHHFRHHTITAITGHNGSGKSTLLQIIAGSTSPSQGTINYQLQHHSTALPHAHLSMAAPYIELIEEFTIHEMVQCYFSFKPLHPSYHLQQLPDLFQLPHTHQPIKNFSSGMKQRLKLGLACTTHTPLLLLDEPCANLDSNGIQWYQMLLNTQPHKTIIIASNSKPEETFAATHTLSITDFKQ
jgi:ABC-type multidrug transport system ATPase subunit